MTGADRLFLRECPVFPPFERTSLAFAFQIDGGDSASASRHTAFRISRVHDAMLGLRPGLSAAQQDRAQRLIRASQSFLDDITTGVPGTNGRPLLLSADTGEAGGAVRKLVVERPESWEYEFEGTVVALQVAAGNRRLELAMQEHFCIFESGRMFYLLVLANLPGRASPLDEYSLIQLQQLAIDKALATDADFLTFHWGGQRLSLLELARLRLAELDRPQSADRPGDATAIGDVLRPFGLIREGGAIKPPVAGDLCNAMVQIEDECLFDTARHAFRHYRMADPAEAQDTEPEEKPHPAWLVEADGAWRKAHLPVEGCDCDSHHALGFGEKEEDAPIPRQLLAFAGLAQGVPDFPRQDDSEIHDSTRPVSVAPENLFFVHPAFELTVGKNWRTLRHAQPTVGACPYALLTWMIAVHDELVVSDMEELIEEMIFGKVPVDAPAAEIGRANPLGNLGRVLDKASALMPVNDKIIDENLAQRLDLFRWCSIHQSGNVFRYPTERELLSRIREARGTQQRFEDAHQLLDRYENLVEDVSTLQSSYVSARTNWLLAAIALFGVAELPGNLENLFNLRSGAGMAATLGILALTTLLFILWMRSTQLRRSRKSS